MLALFPHRLNRWYGLPAQGVAIDDWAADNFDHADLDFIGGGNLWVYSDRRPIAAARMPTFGARTALGLGVEGVRGRQRRPLDQLLSSEVDAALRGQLPRSLIRPSPIRSATPVCRITADFKDNERRIATFVQDRMVEWFRAAGAVEIIRQGLGTMGPSTHAYGGTRMGDNRETNVIDRWGFSHETPNLGILGASVMGTSGSHNPTLTAQALAWRTAAHLVENWSSISG